MKKFLFIFTGILLIFNCYMTDAQSKYFPVSLPYYGYGVKGGVNIASQTSAGEGATVDVTSILGFNGGAYFTWFFTRVFAVQPELMISRKGSHWEDYYDNVSDYITYIDVPLLFRYQPMKYYNFHAGPQVGYRMSAVQKDHDSGTKTDIRNYYKDFDLGLVLGVEANFPFKVNFTVRYVLGVSPATTNVVYIDPWRNNILQISLGYRISGK